ncbi:hypothetical protein BDV96DRAFT_606750 [Lophiotrema nucula]|uniref:Glucose-methanol-choline oxidoreductase N-terminal domain-containing protein n=1 Tax=Lophiotrema nucula TaxID=690887 RepID=A0A6A5YIV0_9PLEO|nr:hypothetical protein BDV96DRAFT_606750 [Lophiotrema nucula]
MPLADRLSESGKTVLLIERGFASSGRWGGTMKPAWLEGTNLTRFDVPALYQSIWTDDEHGGAREGVFCSDVTATASCVLGGGTAVNAGQWYKPQSADWDLNMPPGWRSADMVSATDKAFSRLPWTDTPSTDGESYLTNGTDILLAALTNSSLPDPYRSVKVDDNPDDRDHVVSKAPFFFLCGEKGGPMATYLVSASQRKKFHLLLNTTVKRVTRTGQEILGVEIESTYGSNSSFQSRIRVTPKTGRVVLSAGVFGTSKILFKSGIGPIDQLKLVQGSSDGLTMITEKSWIDRPVGYNLDDAPSVYLAVASPAFGGYPWEIIYDSPISTDVEQYLDTRSGPLAQIQPSLGPAFWDKIEGEDGKTRWVQWTANAATGTIAVAANLVLGHTSRGRLTISSTNSSALIVGPSTLPYFNDAGDHDFAALLKASEGVLEVLKTIANATVFYPPEGTSLEDYLRSATNTTNSNLISLSSNHWTGSTQMRASCEDPEAVVDATTRVCGTRNLHVVDAGIVNGVPTANPQGVFVVLAERAAEVILGLEGGATFLERGLHTHLRPYTNDNPPSIHSFSSHLRLTVPVIANHHATSQSSPRPQSPANNAATGSTTARPASPKPPGGPATVMRRKAAADRAEKTANQRPSSTRAAGAGGSSSTMLRLYTDESPGLKVDPVVVMTLSVVFIFSVVALHVIAKVMRRFTS